MPARAAPDPRSQILAFFDPIITEVESGQYRGCPLMMTLAEFPDPDLPAHRNAVAGKWWIRQRIGELTDRLGIDNSAELADHLMLVHCR